MFMEITTTYGYISILYSFFFDIVREKSLEIYFYCC